ncbi:MAG TPA: YbhB/YbcL family Raf kinase inhibitor-like protein [Polyangia bacterium]
MSLLTLGCSSGGGSGGSGGTNGSGGASGTGGAGTGGSGTGGASGTGGSTGTGGTGTGGSGGSVVDASVDASGDANGGMDTASNDSGTDVVAGPLTMTSTSLKMMGPNLVFPAANSAPMNMSPALAWTGVPAGTLSFAISMYDVTMTNTHWILWDIPASLTMLPAGLPRGAMPTNPAGASQKDAFNNTAGWEGPGGGSVDNYELEIWALNVAKLPNSIAGQSLNTMHSTGLATAKIASFTIKAQGKVNGL